MMHKAFVDLLLTHRKIFLESAVEYQEADLGPQLSGLVAVPLQGKGRGFDSHRSYEYDTAFMGKFIRLK